MAPTASCKRRPQWGLTGIALAIVFAAAVVFTAATSFAQGIATDKLNYVPGETVTISGQGWQPMEAVTLTVGNAAGTRTPVEIDVIAGSDGSFIDRTFVAQEIDRDQMLTIFAQGASGSQTLIAVKDGVGPGSLRCSTLNRYDTNHYGLSQGQQVMCTIEGATDLSPAQQAGTEPVEVLVRSAKFGNERATVLSVVGTTITFQYTAPATGCDTSIVSYGPIKVCDVKCGQCTTFPTAGNDANSYILSGTHMSAGFAYMNAGRAVCCNAPKLKVEKYPQNGTFAQGEQATYTIIVSNPVALGGSWANNVKLTDVLPGNGGMIWQSATPTQGTCVNPIVNNTLDCSLGTIQPQKSVTVVVKTTPMTPPAACQCQPNARATATADNGFIAYASGSLSCVPPPTQLKVVKTPDNGTFTQGSQVSFTIVVSNPGAYGSGTAKNVHLNDALPGNGGLIWATASTTAGSCSISNNVLSCLLGDIMPGNSVTVRVFSTAPTPDAACQYLLNDAAIATADGGITAEDSGSLNCTPSRPPQLKVVKTPDNGIFTQGSQISYTIVVSNPAAAGSGSATNVTLTDQLPGNGGLVWATATPSQGACSLSSNSLSCALGTIPAGNSVVVMILSTPMTPNAACQPQPNPVALATADGGLMAQDSGSQSCTPPTAPQLKVVKTPDNGTFTQGAQVRFTIVVSNPGTGTATDVRLTDALPTNGGLTWTSATTTQGTCSVINNTLSCSLLNIMAGGSVTVVVASPTTTPNSACTSQPNPVALATAAGGLSAQDSGSLNCTPPTPPTLRVVKTPDNGTFTQNGPVSFTIVVSNPSATTATNVRLTDTLPTGGGLTWAGVTTTRGTCSISGANLTCSFGNLTAGASATVVVSSPATTPDLACMSQPNPAAIATADGGITARDSGSQSCTPRPQLRVVKTPDNGTFTQGSQVSYTIVVSNPAPAGASAATSVTLTDALPTNGGLTWTSVITTQGTCSIANNNLSCGLGTIPAQGSVTVVVSSPATTPASACLPQPNPVALATAAGGLTAQDSGSLFCTPPAQLQVVKTPDNGTFTLGGQASFTIVVSNPAAAGSAPATGVTLNDVLPTNGGLTWTSATSTQGSCSITNNTLNCSLGTIAAGGSVTVVVSSPATTPASACQSQPNPAAIATAAGGLTAQDSGSLTCSAPCIIPGVTISNTSWNAFNIPAGTSPVVWVHAHIGTPSGVPTNTVTTVLFNNVSITVNGTRYPLPDGLLIFNPAAPSTPTTTFNAAANRWETVINPNNLSNELFFTGGAIPVTPALAAGGKATFTFSVASQAPRLSFPWQWSAAVYTFWPADWNQAMILPYHASLHAGTPLNTTVQRSLIQGPRGGGGSNFTGSWSATGNGTCP